MRLSTLPLLLAIAWPAFASAQEVVQALPGSSDADLLAATMRRVAANPLDLDALLTAGEQSLKVDDRAGAASLFARAEKIDPRNGRVKAGMASILVRSERPGEALRYFAQAEAAGLDPRRFAADRGFAYDLTGDQQRAQLDYRLALATNGRDDETVRRYALSLGISGRTQEAEQELRPLLGRSDRAAWRARAFILAMAGDQAGAEKIAATMMPGGMAQGLRPFFERLPMLPATDRAFAVHFGEVRPTPERIADARLAPVLPPLPVTRPVQVAAATVPTPSRQETRRERQAREKAERRARQATALAARGGRTVPGRVSLSATTSLPTAAAVVTRPVEVATLTPARTAVAPAAGEGALPAPGFSSAATGASVPVPVTLASVAAPVPAAVSALPAVSPAAPVTSAVTLASAPVQPVTMAGVSASTGAARAAVTGDAGLAPLVTPAAGSPTVPSGVALAAINGSGVRAPASPVRGAARRSTPSPSRTHTADSVLARIVASLSIPAAELGVERPVRAAAVGSETGGAARTAEALRTKAARDAEADAVAKSLAAATRRSRRGAAPAEPAAADLAAAKTTRGRASAQAEAEAPVLTAAEKRAAARKQLADKKAAAEKKAAADKAAEEKRIVRTNPSRIWVQVAGGAYEGDLPKAWAATKAKAPDAFAGRSGYAAKLRATNRVVTGPFKTDAEARAFVNRLAKSGVSAFPFTSDAGEAVTRLPAK